MPTANGNGLGVRLARGERGALDEIYRSYYARVQAYALRRVVDPADADDIAQEVFLQIHRSMGSYQGRSQLSTWIFGIAHHVICRHYRSQRGARVPLEGADVEARLSYRPPTEERIDAMRAIAHCHAALLRGRTQEHRRIFELFYVGGRPMRVIATGLGQRPGSVKDSLRRSRELLLREVPELRQVLHASSMSTR